MVLCDQWRIDVEASVVEGTVEFLAHHGRRLPFHFHEVKRCDMDLRL